MLLQSSGIHAQRVVDAACVVLHRHQLRTCFYKQATSSATHIAKALHGHPCTLYRQADQLGRFHTHGKHAATCGFHTPQ